MTSSARARSGALSFDEYQGLRYFPALDGVRAISIALVLFQHSGDPLWRPINGHLGVTLFFGISGYLITTLLLREEARDGRVSLGGFYLRRAFRILPLYYVALACFTVLVLVLHLGSDRGAYPGRLPYFLLYMNELAPDGTFGHSWSLAIEEKYYLVWPLIAFALAPRRTRRTAIAAGLVLVTGLTALLPGWWPYPAIYTPILTGCLVALLMHARGGYERLAVLRSSWGAVALAVAIAVGVAVDNSEGHVHVLFGLLAAAVMVPVVAGPEWFRRILGVRPLVFIGTRSYAIYLFHPISNSVIDRALAPGQESVPVQVARYVLELAAALAVADVLHRVLERPVIRLGHRLAHRRKAERAVPAAR